MILKMQRRIAARILRVGENKVWMNPLRLNEIKEAITKQDVLDLIKDGAMTIREKTGIKTKVKRKRKGPGKKKGKSRRGKRDYMMKIRKLRRFIKLLKENSIINTPEARKMRALSKSGYFKSQRHLKEHITGIMKRDLSKLEKK